MSVVEEVLVTAIHPALDLLPARMRSAAAVQLLIAIGLQESRLTQRYQVVAGKPSAKGPARGLWQFEAGGGVAGVLGHPESRDLARWICHARKVPINHIAVWRALEEDDVLAAGLARLLLYTDPKPLPKSQAAGWAYYLRTWRPGKPHDDTWPALYASAAIAAGDA